jgi:c-di-GMP-binding flagellar brake protein YcgR
MGAELVHGADRRRAGRIGAAIRATVHVAELTSPELNASRARVRDISDVGIRLLLLRRLPVGARVTVDLECELPLRVHLGFDVHSLVVNGPMHTHLVRIAGTVTRIERLPNRLFEVGIELCEDTTRFDELQVMKYYVDHLREQEDWSF